MKRADRRDSSDEKIQLDVIKNCSKEVVKLYENKEIELDLEDFKSISRGKNSCYFSHEGKLVNSKTEKRNPFIDTKTLDAVTYFRNKDGKSLSVYYFCKYTKEQGGMQDYIPFEISVTKNCIDKNTDDDVVLFFMLEGGFWDDTLINKASFDNEKTFYVNQENLTDTLISVLKNKNLI